MEYEVSHYAHVFIPYRFKLWKVFLYHFPRHLLLYTVINHYFNIIKYSSGQIFFSAEVNSWIFFCVTSGIWCWYVTETVSQVCKNCLQRNCYAIYILDVWLESAWLLSIKSGSQLSEVKHFLILSQLRYNAEDSHGAIEIKRTVIRVLHVAILWHTEFPLFRFSWFGVTGGLVSDRVLFKP
jgi:hypothetical protein